MTGTVRPTYLTYEEYIYIRMYLNEQKSLLAVFFTILMVTSLIVVPFTAGAASIPSVSSSDTVNTNVTPQVETTSDDNKIHVKKNLEDLKVGMEVEPNPYDSDSPRSDASWADVYVSVEGEPNGVDDKGPYYPFRHNLDIVLTVSDEDGQVIQESTDFRLLPSGSEPYQATAEFDIRVPQDSATTYDFEAEVRTKGGIDQIDTEYDANNHPTGTLTESATINGTSSSTRATSDINIQTTDVYRELSSIAYMNSYKATTNPDQVDNMEDLSLPGSDLSGEVSNFQGGAEKSSIDSGYTTFESTNDQMKIVTGTLPIEQNEPQTLVVQYLNTGSTPINLDLVNSASESIDSDTEYKLQTNLTDEVRDYTFEGTQYNIATIRLSEEEQGYINNRGEAFVEYSADGSSSIQVFCQSFISGSISFNDEACGLNSDPVDVESGLITDMTLTDEDGNTISFDSQEEFVVDANETVDVTTTVQNTGNSIISDSVYLFSDISSTQPIETESERFLEGVDYNQASDDYYTTSEKTVSFENEHNPDYVDLLLSGSSNEGRIEVTVEAQGGSSTTKVYPNINSSKELNLGDEFSLTQSTDTYYITVKSEERPEFEGLAPQINSFQLQAQDPTSTSEFSPKSVNIAPGDTQTVSFNDINVGDVTKQITFKSLFLDDSKEIQIDVNANRGDFGLVAEAGGPYQVRLPITDIYREQIGTQTIEAAEKPEPTGEWSRVSDEPVRTGTATQTERVEVTRAPQLVNPTASTSEIENAIQRWQRNGFMRDLDLYFPEGTDLNDWEPVRVEYQDKIDERTIISSESDMESKFGRDFTEDGWRKVQEAGTEVTGYETSWESTVDSGSTAETQNWTPVQRNDPKEVWDRNEEYQTGQYLITERVERINSIETGQLPLECGSNVSELTTSCNSQTSSSYWVRSDEPTRIVNIENSQGSYIEQCTEINPGNAWSPTDTQDCANPADTNYERLVTGTQSLYQWNEYTENQYYLFAKPNQKVLNEYVQDMYKTTIIFEKETTGDIYEYQGPEYNYKPIFEPVNLELDASNSVGSIEEYNWSFGSTTENPQTDLRISEPENREVTLTVTDELGRTATDTAQINVLAGCTSGSCSWENGITDLSLNTSDTVNYEQGITDIETQIEAQTLSQEWVIELTPAEAQSLRIDENVLRCPEGYTGATSPNDVPDDYTFDGESGVLHCFYTGDSVLPEDATEKFAHPNDPDSDTSIDDIEYTTGNPSASLEIWRGSSISNLTTLSDQINQRLNSVIQPGEQKYTVTARPADNTRGRVSSTDSTTYCLTNTTEPDIPSCEDESGGDDGSDDTGGGDDGGDDGGVEPPTNVPPQPDFTIDSTPVEVDNNVDFTANATDPDGTIEDYSWNLELRDVHNKTGNSETISHVYRNTGVWDVTLEVTDDDGASNSITKQVKVTGEGPTADFDINPNPVEVDKDVTFDASASSGSISSYDWSYTDEPGSTETDRGQTVTTSYQDGGREYTVSLTVTDTDGFTDTTVKSVRVENEGNTDPPAPPVADPLITPNQPYVGDTVEFNGRVDSFAQGSDNSITSYEWQFEKEDGTFETEDTGVFSYTYDEPGVYEFELTVTDELGQTDTYDTGEITVRDSDDPPPEDIDPIARIEPDGDSSTVINPGETVQLQSVSSAEDPDATLVSEQWSVIGSGDSTTGSTAEYTFTEDATVKLVVTDSNGNSDTATQPIDVTIDGPREPRDPENGSGGGGGGGGDGEPRNDERRQSLEVCEGLYSDVEPDEDGKTSTDSVSKTIPKECMNTENTLIWGQESYTGWTQLTGPDNMKLMKVTDQDTLEYGYNILSRSDRRLTNFYEFDSVNYHDNFYYEDKIGDADANVRKVEKGTEFITDTKPREKPLYSGDARLDAPSPTGSGFTGNYVATQDGSYVVGEGAFLTFEDNPLPSESYEIRFFTRINPRDAGLYTDQDSPKFRYNTENGNQINALERFGTDDALIGFRDWIPATAPGLISSEYPLHSPIISHATYNDSEKGQRDYQVTARTLKPNWAAGDTEQVTEQTHANFADDGSLFISPVHTYGLRHSGGSGETINIFPDSKTYEQTEARNSNNAISQGKRAVFTGESYLEAAKGGGASWALHKVEVDADNNINHSIYTENTTIENEQWPAEDFGSDDLIIGGGTVPQPGNLSVDSFFTTYPGVIDNLQIYDDQSTVSDTFGVNSGESTHRAKITSFSQEYNSEEVWEEGLTVQVKDEFPKGHLSSNSVLNVTLTPVQEIDAGSGSGGQLADTEVVEDVDPWKGRFIRQKRSGSENYWELDSIEQELDTESSTTPIDGFKLDTELDPDRNSIYDANRYDVPDIDQIKVEPRKVTGSVDGSTPKFDMILERDEYYNPEGEGNLMMGIEENPDFRDGDYDVRMSYEFEKDTEDGTEVIQGGTEEVDLQTLGGSTTTGTTFTPHLDSDEIELGDTGTLKIGAYVEDGNGDFYDAPSDSKSFDVTITKAPPNEPLLSVYSENTVQGDATPPSLESNIEEPGVTKDHVYSVPEVSLPVDSIEVRYAGEGYEGLSGVGDMTADMTSVGDNPETVSVDGTKNGNTIVFDVPSQFENEVSQMTITIENAEAPYKVREVGIVGIQP